MASRLWRSQVHDPPERVVNLLSVWAELEATVPADDRALAERALTVPMVEVQDADLGAALSAATRKAFDFVIVDGVVLKETTLARRAAVELLGPGDVLAPPLRALHEVQSRAVSRYLAHGSASVAVLDDRFRLAARRWPAVSDLLHERLGRQTHRASMHLAMMHLARVEDRVVALFADLAERFGRVTPAGIVIDLALTHELIGRIVGSRRPTVSLALQSLASGGLLSRAEGDRWILAPDVLSPRPFEGPGASEARPGPD